MRRPSVSGFLVLAVLLGVSSATFANPGTPKKIQAKFHVANVDTKTTSSIQITYDNVAREDKQAISDAVQPRTSWSILVDNKLSIVGVQSASVKSAGGIIVLQLTGPLEPDLVLRHHISILFAGNPAAGVLAETVEVKQPDPSKMNIHGWFPPQFNFTSDKKNPNLDVSGSLQSGVGAKPQYQWNVVAKAPFEYNASNWVLNLGPKFTGVASQETNADPDSLSASLATEFDFPYPHVSDKLVPINLLFNPVDYEFERKLKQEAVLNNGQATLHNYQQKNTNVIVSGQVQFVEGWWPVNLNINLGIEAGSAVSRSVLNLTAKPGYSDSPLRAVAGADVYFNLPKVAKYPFLIVDGHYTVRSPFHAEPFKQAGVNNGNQFYSTKARHYIAVNLARPIVKGSNFTVQYRYGSLPPTFNFVDHQVTIGFEVVLGK
jgi:hypothetical protein